MKKTVLSKDLSPVFNHARSLDAIIKSYSRVWASEETKSRFIKTDKRKAFNHLVLWAIDCQNLNYETTMAFNLLEDQLKTGVTDTKSQGQVNWYTFQDVIMQFCCNDIAYRIRSMWDKLGQVINTYFLRSKYPKEKVSLHTAVNALKKEGYSSLVTIMENVIKSKVFSDVKSYRDDFTHNLTQELANRYKLHGRFWHTDELIDLMVNSYQQVIDTYGIVFKSIGQDAAYTAIIDFQEMHDKTPFFGG